MTGVQTCALPICEMRSNFEGTIEIFPHNFRWYLEFSRFEQYIMNNDMIAKRYQSRAHQIYKEQVDQNREAAHNRENDLLNITTGRHSFICVVSGNPNTMGDMLAVNIDITQVLGYKPKELIGQNCGILCPLYISQKHNQILENFLMRGTSNSFNNRRIMVEPLIMWNTGCPKTIDII